MSGAGTRVLKLLLIAPACDGEGVGEAWVAFQWVRALAARHDITVLTYHKRGRLPLSAQLPSVRTAEWAEPPGLGRAERFNSLLKPGYLAFYACARRWIRAALARGEHFDLAHQVAPVSLRYPSPVTGLPIPYLIGPVGGSLQSPPGFAAEEGAAGWYTGLRRLDRLRLRRDPWLRATYRQADCVIGIAPYVADLLAGVGVRRLELMSETALERLPEPVDRAASRGEVRLLFVGRVIRTKGVRDAIRALGHLRYLPVSLDVVGEGPDRPACQALTAELGLGDRVRFHGWLPRPEVAEWYRAADVFVFPSYREPGGNAVLEAMAHGLPLLVSDLGGPGQLADDSCGIRVHPASPEQYPRDLARALALLASEPQLRRRLSEGARRRVHEVGLWDRKVTRAEEIYAEIARPAAAL